LKGSRAGETDSESFHLHDSESLIESEAGVAEIACVRTRTRTRTRTQSGTNATPHTRHVTHGVMLSWTNNAPIRTDVT
jgi:hypothetical protein